MANLKIVAKNHGYTNHRQPWFLIHIRDGRIVSLSDVGASRARDEYDMGALLFTLEPLVEKLLRCYYSKQGKKHRAQQKKAKKKEVA